MSLIDPINEKELMEQAAKNLGPLLADAITRLESMIGRFRDDTEIEITVKFKKKEQ